MPRDQPSKPISSSGMYSLDRTQTRLARAFSRTLPNPTEKKQELQKAPQPSYFVAIYPECFSAQALMLADKALRTQAFAVIEQHSDNHRAVILSVSPKARDLGVTVGLPVSVLKRRRISIGLRVRDLSAEGRARAALLELLHTFTPAAQCLKTGLALADLTGTPLLRHVQAHSTAEYLRMRVLELGFSEVAVGVAATRFMAQVLARQAQPNGIAFCLLGKEAETIAPLSASALPGLSPHCRIRLKDFGLKTVGQIAALPRTALVARFGTEGDRLYTYAHGSDPDSASSNLEDTVTDTSPGMNPDGSIEVALTLAHDVNDEKTLRSETRLLVDRLVDMLRQRRLACDAMTVVLTYADGRLVRRSLKWKEPTGAYIDLAARAEETLLGLYQRRVALKRIQLKVPRPRSESLQAGLFDDNSLLKQRALGEAITRIRKKNNFGVIFTASHTHNSK